MSPDPASHCLFRRRRKEARPAELLDAALALFVEKGFAATRSEEVAKAAGVSKGTLYLYFPSKEELLKAVIQHFLVDQIAAGAQEAEALEGTTPEVMHALLVTWWKRIYDSPASGVFKLVITEVCNFPEIAQFYAERVIEPGNRLVAGLLARGIERGEFRPIDIESAVQSIVMPMVLMCVHKHSLGATAFGAACGIVETDPRGFMSNHLQLVLTGLEVRAATPPAVGAARQSPQLGETSGSSAA